MEVLMKFQVLRKKPNFINKFLKEQLIKVKFFLFLILNSIISFIWFCSHIKIQIKILGYEKPFVILTKIDIVENKLEKKLKKKHLTKQQIEDEIRIKYFFIFLINDQIFYII